MGQAWAADDESSVKVISLLSFRSEQNQFGHKIISSIQPNIFFTKQFQYIINNGLAPYAFNVRSGEKWLKTSTLGIFNKNPFIHGPSGIVPTKTYNEELAILATDNLIKALGPYEKFIKVVYYIPYYLGYVVYPSQDTDIETIKKIVSHLNQKRVSPRSIPRY
jgi:hypothetical protein